MISKAIIVLILVSSILIYGCSTSEIKQIIYDSLRHMQNRKWRGELHNCNPSNDLDYNTYQTERERLLHEEQE